MKPIHTATAALALVALAPLASARHVNMVAQQDFQASSSTGVEMIRPMSGGSSHRPYVRRFRPSESRMNRVPARIDQNRGSGQGSEHRRADQAKKLADC